MNVVGKVGSLITTVTTPFHPFGGAIDVIVVRQQDGTFRSTPWHVRFGKFQGVLKGAEKFVRIQVNGLEVGFHMYLDDSGETYFEREVDFGLGNETDGVTRGSEGGQVMHEIRIRAMLMFVYLNIASQILGLLSCTMDVSPQVQYVLRDQSLIPGSMTFKMSSSPWRVHLVYSEVVLLSVDGHVLMAPVSASEQNAENVQFSMPQFHLGPGKGTGYCEGNKEFSSGDNKWAADYISKFNSATTNDEISQVCSMNHVPNALSHELNVCEGEEEHACQTQQDSPSIANQATNLDSHVDAEDALAINKNGNIVQSCLEPLELANDGENTNVEEKVSTLEGQSSEEKPPHSQPDVDESQDGAISQSRINEGFSPPNTSDSPGNNRSSDLQDVGKRLSLSAEMEEMDVHVEGPTPEDDGSRSEIVETKKISIKEMQTYSSMRFDISLCGNELHAGMGLKAAAEVFDAHHISMEEYKDSAVSVTIDRNLVFRFGERYLTWDKAAPIVLGIAAFGLDLPIEPKDAIPVEQVVTPNSKEDDSVGTSSSSSHRWRLWLIPFRRAKTLVHNNGTSSSEGIFVDNESSLQNYHLESGPVSNGRIETPRKQFIRTYVPTSDQIASLNLKDGQNIVTFSFSTRILGTQQVDAHIYSWKWDDRIVISDVDGTITKSDVLGQFMPLVGRDWSQSGVAALFSAIKENGYQLLFLSARAIVQAYLTRNFLFNLKQ
ncbi:hypothetical protein SLEP1_g17718 [Rubroshorea leprosula]|nr:hypothetical protein SLEP1_g17718 [Rubroshorea leprosula]